MIIAGHGVHQAMAELGRTEINVLLWDHRSGKRRSITCRRQPLCRIVEFGRGGLD
jgi:hypothetical protein